MAKRSPDCPQFLHKTWLVARIMEIVKYVRCIWSAHCPYMTLKSDTRDTLAEKWIAFHGKQFFLFARHRSCARHIACDYAPCILRPQTKRTRQAVKCIVLMKFLVHSSGVRYAETMQVSFRKISDVFVLMQWCMWVRRQNAWQVSMVTRYCD